MSEMPERIFAWMYTGGFNRGEWLGQKSDTADIEYVRADLYAALEAQLAERVKEAAILGWNVCRMSIYAVCEDIAEQADRMEPITKARNEAEAQHAKGYYAGHRHVAKSTARGFSAMNAEDDDNLIAILSALEATPPAPKVTDAAGQREVLLFASYCGDDNTACTEVRPCPICLGMSNVVAIPNDTPLEHRRALEPRWNSNKHLEALNARRIGKAPKCTLTAAQEAGKP